MCTLTNSVHPVPQLLPRYRPDVLLDFRRSFFSLLLAWWLRFDFALPIGQSCSPRRPAGGKSNCDAGLLPLDAGWWNHVDGTG